MRWISGFLLVAFLSGEAVAAPCKKVSAGAVVDFSHPAADYRIERGGEDIQLTYFMQLRPGDRVTFAHDGFLSIQSGNGTATWRRINAPLCIVEGEVPNWIERAQASIGDRLTRSRDRGSVPMITRSEGPLRAAFEGAEAGEAIIASGERRLAFAWQGGVAPFSVRLSEPGGALLVDEHEIMSRTLILRKPRRLSEGTHTLEVADASGDPPLVVQLVAGPEAPPVGDAASAMARAGELASRGQELDAFMTLSPFREDSASAAAFMTILAAE